MTVGEWFQRASATFVGGGVAIGILAVPTFVWLPREFDGIEQSLEALSASTNQAAINASAAASNAAATIAGQEALTLEIAQWQAVPIGAFDNLASSMSGVFTPLPAPRSYMSTETFLSYFPADVKRNVQESDLVSKFSYADFVGREWIFVSSYGFNELAAADQMVIQERLGAAGIRFFVNE